MYAIDDPMLALILRFIGCSPEISFRDEEFRREQLEAIRDHLEGSPREHHQALALEWVEQHARAYRDRWAQGVVVDLFSGARCEDCPLAGTEPAGSCRIHDRWLDLLQRYVANEISTRAYAESSLTLLAQHKEILKVRAVQPREMQR